MKPSDDHVKRDQDACNIKLTHNVKGLLGDLVSKSSNESDLKIGARVLRLAKSMNIFDSSMESYEAILRGDNSHQKDFCKALED